MGGAGAAQPHTSAAPHIAACWNPPRCGVPWAWGTPTLCRVPGGDKPASAVLALIAANGIAMTQPSSLALPPAPSHPLSLPAPLLTQVFGPLLSSLFRLPVPCLGLLSICCRETRSEQNKLHPGMGRHEGPHVSSGADSHPPPLLQETHLAWAWGWRLKMVMQQLEWHGHPWGVHPWGSRPWGAHPWGQHPWRVCPWGMHPWGGHPWRAYPWGECPWRVHPWGTRP